MLQIRNIDYFLKVNLQKTVEDLWYTEMSKRRRTSSVASRGQEEDSIDADPHPEPVKKKKKFDPFSNSQSELCHQLYDTIRNFKKEDGSLVCDAFIRVPKRRQEPGYYEVVTNPIDLLKVQQKLKTDEYEDADQLTTDVELMVNNAKAFYKKSSQEYKDACDLWDLFVATKCRLMDAADGRLSEESGEHKGKLILKARKAAAAVEGKTRIDADMDETSEGSSNNPDEEVNLVEELFTAVMMATDQDTRPLHTVFQLLPSKKRYPEYFEVIEHPIDLKMIATKIQENKYPSLNELEKDLLLMTRNACTFNEPGSQIYKDAKSLRKIITSKKIEIEHGKFTPGKSSERIRNKRLRGSQSLSAITAALQYEEDESEEDDEDEEGEEDDDDEEDDEEDEGGVDNADNPQWQLYDDIRSCSSNSQGLNYLLSEPFWRLPSKRYYPDYYKEIKNPISLCQIRSKLRRGEYGTISEVAGDMNIMFENAKKYNRPDSRIYKDAVKLQKMMQNKVQELLEFHQESDSDDDMDEKGIKKRNSKSRSSPGTYQGKSKPREDTPLKKKLMALHKTLIDYVREDSRQPILMFMEKPSKKLYPDYYQVIAEPIDMLMIEARIKSDTYGSIEEITEDFKLMFNNCRQYNEEGSMIYEDANKLESVLMEKVREFGPTQEVNAKRIIKVYGYQKPKVKKNVNVLAQKLRTLYDTIRDHKDPKGRQLSLIFLKLPSKNEYPDYYEVIKRPIDLEKIAQKLKTNQYESLDDMVSDFVLMFDNACKYNEPDSQIYKDALMLQRVALQTKLQLREDEEAVTDVGAAVQELLTSLFTSAYNHQDEEGRCFSDSMAELPEHDETEGKKTRALSLDLIKRRLDRGLYRRLDVFQEDMFACLERARKLSRTDSQVFEDSIELQSFFIRQRDELCRGGDLLHSPALNYTQDHLAMAVEAIKQEKLLQETPEDEVENRNPEESMKEASVTPGESLSFNQQLYRIGDFVYAEPKERGMESHIIHIERLWTNQEGHQMLYGNFFYRPNETYHVTTRKFMEKEVFKSDAHIALPLSQVIGLCCVMSVKDYFRSKPEGFSDKDIYVCESRYSTKARSFKKIKNWPFCVPEHVNLMPRDEMIEPKRVMSVFRERVEKHKEEIAELEEGEKLLEKMKPNVEVFNPLGVEGNTYYEQYNVSCGTIKTGDCVYVRADTGRQLIAQIDSIWITKEGAGYFRGPWFVTPPEIPHAPTRLFYKQEVFLSTIEDTNPLLSIIGKCAVLEHAEYISCRPTEIPEQDVYVSESVYDEARRQVRRLTREGLKKYAHSNTVTEDEIYFFRRLINPPKIGGETAQKLPEGMKIQMHYDTDLLLKDPSPLLPKMVGDPEGIMMDDSLDGGTGTGPPSVGSGDMPVSIPISTPSSGKKKAPSKKQVSGYILYSGDVRRGIAAKFPDSSFGEISRIVGNEWRNLCAQDKQIYEEKAARINEETAAKMAAMAAAAGETGSILNQTTPTTTSSNQSLQHQQDSSSSSSPAPQGAPGGLPGGGCPGGSGGASGNTNTNGNPADLVYECLWDHCDWQFEDQTDLTDHCIQEPNGHVQQYFVANPDADFQCQWKGCGRLKKQAAPFPSVQRLARHVKEVHIQKGNGRPIPPHDRNRNYMASRRQLMTPTRHFNPASTYGNYQMQSPHSHHSPFAHAISGLLVPGGGGSGSTVGPQGQPGHAVPPHLLNSSNSNSSNSSAFSRQTPSPLAHGTVVTSTGPLAGATTHISATARHLEPIFVSVPPRPQRLLHSEAYIKYIEGLQADNKYISQWERHLKATPENTRSVGAGGEGALGRLPGHWLANGAGDHGSILNALWTLRDFMLRDALSISRTDY
ncbi:protein polybromo-1 isoform X3 [Hetaerina americana]|uniref:protein polybromo-1 isoform X3 n=1 Tax=Hetaerina americana TaxID=62018 RepID=UPI003A7F2450